MFCYRDLSNQLKSILAIWFSVGLLQLTRITWETPADILEKVANIIMFTLSLNFILLYDCNNILIYECDIILAYDREIDAAH